MTEAGLVIAPFWCGYVCGWLSCIGGLLLVSGIIGSAKKRKQ